MGNKQRKRKQSAAAIRRINKQNVLQRYVKKKRILEQRKAESSLNSDECITIKEENTAEWEASEPSVSDPLAMRHSAVGTTQERTYAPLYSPSDLQNVMSDLTTASILKISDEKTFQLIDLYHNEDCLWNTNSEDYKNKEKRSLAAEKIAAILDLPNFTAKHVVMKFLNIRNMYNQELKKIAHSKAVGGDTYVPRGPWFAKMDSFIGPHIHRRATESLSKEKQSQDDTEQEQFLVTISEPVYNEECSEPKRRKLPIRRTKDAKDDDAAHRRTKNAKEDADHRRTKNLKEKDPVNIAETLKDIQSKLLVLTSSDDHDTFGRYVASLLRALPPQKALALHPKIVSLITDVGERVEEDPLDAGSEQRVEIKLEIAE